MVWELVRPLPYWSLKSWLKGIKQTRICNYESTNILTMSELSMPLDASGLPTGGEFLEALSINSESGDSPSLSHALVLGNHP
jgi:hypothetical protein